jgi:hypothetical protein
MVERSPHDDLRLDFLRAQRTGLPEAILCGHKSPAHIEALVAQALARNASLLFTRLDVATFAGLADDVRALLEHDALSRTAILGTPTPTQGEPEVAIVTAGTSDAFVSRECARTLQFAGVPVLEVSDVGVAGLWRLLERVPELVRMRVVIAVAGMDAALPSVLGGLVPGVVVAVPTSTGYGVAHGGQTALHAILASCAPGVLACNIDNGYGAACAAMRIVRASSSPTPSGETP